MNFLIQGLWGVFAAILPSLVGRVLLALGFSYITYSGFDLSVTWLLTQIKENMSAMGAEVVSFLAYMWVDKAIGVIFSAYSAALMIKMAGATTMTKLVRKG